MGSIAASSPHLSGAVARPTVSLAGGKMGAITASGARLRRTQGHAKVLSSPLRGRWCHGGTAARSAGGQEARSRTRGCELDADSTSKGASRFISTEIHLALYWSSR